MVCYVNCLISVFCFFVIHTRFMYGFLFAGVGAGGEEQKASAISIFHLPWLAIFVAIMFVGTLPHASSAICICISL